MVGWRAGGLVVVVRFAQSFHTQPNYSVEVVLCCVVVRVVTVLP